MTSAVAAGVNDLHAAAGNSVQFVPLFPKHLTEYCKHKTYGLVEDFTFTLEH